MKTNRIMDEIRSTISPEMKLQMDLSVAIANRIYSILEAKGMSQKELELLAVEIRDFLVDHVSKTGGHLASNLGVVELTIALHKIFNSPEDKII